MLRRNNPMCYPIIQRTLRTSKNRLWLCREEPHFTRDPRRRCPEAAAFGSHRNRSTHKHTDTHCVYVARYNRERLCCPRDCQNSCLSSGSFLNAPRIADVTVSAPTCFTPLEHMHMCEHSMTTAAPLALATSMSASQICCVSLSCICSRRARASAMRASLDSPRRRPCRR